MLLCHSKQNAKDPFFYFFASECCCIVKENFALSQIFPLNKMLTRETNDDGAGQKYFVGQVGLDPPNFNGPLYFMNAIYFNRLTDSSIEISRS